jgi:hypothetical protein
MHVFDDGIEFICNAFHMGIDLVKHPKRVANGYYTRDDNRRVPVCCCFFLLLFVLLLHIQFCFPLVVGLLVSEFSPTTMQLLLRVALICFIFIFLVLIL